MTQQWLAVIGLVLDFAGFCLLLVEWWLNIFNEEHQLLYERMLERDRNLRSFAQTNSPDALRKHLETAGRMQDEAAITRARTERVRTMSRRKRWFLAAAALVVAGFVFQLLGNWPGCCSALGITPQSMN